MNYTIHHNPEINRRIIGDLSRIRMAILASYGKSVIAIVLSGGFGRGEGTVIRQNGSYIPFNDYDIIIITPPGVSSLPGLPLLAIRLAKSIRIRFVDIACLPQDRLPHLKLNLFNYDLKYGSQIFWGNTNILNEIPNFNPLYIPEKEGILSVRNRLITPFEFLTSGVCSGRTFDPAAYIQTAKCVLACTDYHLVRHHRYIHLYRKKSAGFNKCVGNNPGLVSFLKVVQIASVVKLDPARINKQLPYLQFLKQTLEFAAYTLRCCYGLSSGSGFDAIIRRHQLATLLNPISYGQYPDKGLIKTYRYFHIENETIRLMQQMYVSIQSGKLSDSRVFARSGTLTHVWLQNHH